MDRETNISLLNSFRLSSFLLLLTIITGRLKNNSVDGMMTADHYTESEILYSHSLDWCVGDDFHPIQWINKDEDVVNAKIAAGSRFPPNRNAKGRIDDLHGFVKDRLLTLPPEAIIHDNLPTLIIENECASVMMSSEKCIFDYAATPAPFQWAQGESNHGPLGGNKEDLLLSIMNWERGDLTIVYVPVSDSSENAKELTRKMISPEQSKLANLHTRGNSSRRNPKKQFALKLPKSETLIPGGAKAKKWVLSAYSADKSYIENKLVYDMYRKLGELQREYSDSWPEKDSLEDLSAQAFAPRSQMVNLIFQGRYTGIYYLMDRVEQRKGRVWLPIANETSSQEPKEVGGIQLPRGNYLLSRDWTEHFKSVLNPSRGSSNLEDIVYADSLLVPNFQNWSDAVFETIIDGSSSGSESEGSTSPMEWSIMAPKHTSFGDSNTDIALLEGFLLQLHGWLKDPIGNDKILSEVIDMHSMARWFMVQEFAKEHDGYVASMYFKVVAGKLYHASPWDYAGTSFDTKRCDNPNIRNPLTVDRETNTYSTRPPCDESTGNMATAGWHVNSNYNIFEELLLCGPIGKQYGLDCSEGKPTITDLKWFFGNIFRVPSLQVEFWKLWDIVIEHGLVERNQSDSGDLFSTDLFADQIFEPIRATVQADHRLWYATLENKNISFDTSGIHSNTCEPLLEEILRNSFVGNTSIEDPFTIPRDHWAFHTAYENGEFIQFYESLVAEEPIDAISDYVNSDYFLDKKKNFFKYRLEWILSQHPAKAISSTTEDSPGSFNPTSADSTLSKVAVAALILVVFVLLAKVFCKNKRSKYIAVGNAEL